MAIFNHTDHVEQIFGTNEADIGLIHSARRINLGDGDDQFIIDQDAGSVDAGNGNDFVRTTDGRLYGGYGNDTLSADGNAELWGEEGDDFLVHWGEGEVFGGNGDDTIVAYGADLNVDPWSRDLDVEGGRGDDDITFHAKGEVDAGRGNDIVRLFGETPIAPGSTTLREGPPQPVEVDAGADDDTIIVSRRALEATETSIIDGGTGTDTLIIEVNISDLRSFDHDVFQAEADAAIANGSGHLSAFHLDVENIETIELVIHNDFDVLV